MKAQTWCWGINRNYKLKKKGRNTAQQPSSLTWKRPHGGLLTSNEAHWEQRPRQNKWESNNSGQKTVINLQHLLPKR